MASVHIFDLITEKKQSVSDLYIAESMLSANQPEYADSSTISPDEVAYYRPDEYYTTSAFVGTQWEKKVITFEERKKISYPSKRGLYVAEILLLEYCRFGKYPKPRAGYPGFWWFTYGIRDVGHTLSQLKERGFLEWSSLAEGLSTLKVEELREILNSKGLDLSGKKSGLIERILSADGLVIPSKAFKYRLTDVGILELAENAYVPYMHRHRYKTIENSRFGKEFNVWSINRQLANRDVSDWINIVGEIETELFGTNIVSMAMKTD